MGSVSYLGRPHKWNRMCFLNLLFDSCRRRSLKAGRPICSAAAVSDGNTCRGVLCGTRGRQMRVDEWVKGACASLTGPPDLAVQSSLAVTSTPSAKATSHSRVL